MDLKEPIMKMVHQSVKKLKKLQIKPVILRFTNELDCCQKTWNTSLLQLYISWSVSGPRRLPNNNAENAGKFWHLIVIVEKKVCCYDIIVKKYSFGLILYVTNVYALAHMPISIVHVVRHFNALYTSFKIMMPL